LQNVAKSLKMFENFLKSCAKRYKTQDAGRGGFADEGRFGDWAFHWLGWGLKWVYE
jgi:hypothetical protein